MTPALPSGPATGPDPRRAPRDTPAPVPRLAGAQAVVLADEGAPGLHELPGREPAAALFMAGRRRLVDFALAEAARAGAAEALVVLGGEAGGEGGGGCGEGGALARHLEGGAARLPLRLVGGGAALLAALHAPGARPGAVALLSGARAGSFDLAALLAAHREGGAPATLLTLPDGEAAGALVLDRGWLGARAGRAEPGPDPGPGPGCDRGPGLLDRLAGLARAEGALREAPQGAPWRGVPDLDAFRLLWLELAGPVPFPLPPERGAAAASGGDALEGPDLVVEAGGLLLTVPRFGARRGGRWTLLEDTVVMPGARVAPGARLARAVVAPGAIVPSNLVVGEDPEEDARWFRVAGAGTTLVTAPMLARRAAERMRLHAGPASRAGLTSLEPS